MKNGLTHRNESLDLLRSIAIFGTIFLHALHEVFARTDYVGGATWWLVNAGNALSKSAIPLFILISGTLLFEKLPTAQSAWQRSRTRLLLPLLFWALVYRLIDTLWFGKPFDPLGLVHLFLNGNVFIFYFLVILAGIYLVHPVVHAYVQQQANPQKVWQRVVVLTLAIGCVYALASYLFDAEGKWWSAVTLWIPYYGYFVLGHLLARAVHDEKNRAQDFRWFGVLALVSWLLLTLANYANLVLVKNGIYLLWHSKGQGVQYFDEYLTPLAIGLSIGLFVVGLRFGTALLKKLRLGTAIRSVSELSFGMYAIHPFVLQLVEHALHFNTANLQLPLWLFAVVKLGLTLVGAWLLSWIVARVPYLAQVSGVVSKSQSAAATSAES